MYLIVNLGLKSIRGIVFDELGEQIYSKAFPVHTSLFKDRVEQDPKEWSTLLERILSDIALNTDLGNKISKVTATTSSSCILGVDEKGEPATKVLMVSDKRTTKEVDDIKGHYKYKEREGKVELSCATSSLIPKVLWFKNNDLPTYSSVKFWLGAGELLNHFFTGKIFTDPLNATKAFYNGNSYENDLIEGIGLDPGTLPPVEDIGSTFSVLPEVIKKYNLHPSCNFVLTTYDAICAVIGSSNGEAYNACDVSGTVTSVRVLHNERVANDNRCLLVQPLNFLKKFIIGSSNNLGGGIIEWHKQAFFDQEGNNVYFQMENQAQLSTIGSGGIVFLPFLLGERAPFVAPNASATFFGMNRSSTIKDLTRAVFESTAYVTRGLIELVESTGIQMKTISVSGGLARFDTINQIKADVCNKPVHVLENFESTSIGAFILMAVATGKYSSFEEAASKIVKIRKTIYPSDKSHSLYNKYFELFQDLNSRLMPLYDNHKQILAIKATHETEIVRNL